MTSYRANTSGTRCTATVSDTYSFHGHGCGNRAKFGEFCGLHSPEEQAKRRKARPPTQHEQRVARAEREEKAQARLVAAGDRMAGQVENSATQAAREFAAEEWRAAKAAL